MFKGTGALVEAMGIIRMVEGLLKAAFHKLAFGRRGPWEHDMGLKRHTIWLTCRTLLAHRVWREFPSLARFLPEILLGGTFQGVPLHCPDFDEPVAKGK